MTNQQCIVCEKIVQCITCEMGHNLCKSCFAMEVKEQCDHKTIWIFCNANRHILCRYCNNTVDNDYIIFKDKYVIDNVDDTICDLFITAKEFAIAEQTKKACTDNNK